MTSLRSPVRSVGEACDRHGCVAYARYGAPVPDASPYEVVVISGGEAPVKETFGVLLQSVRAGYEVVEAYVRLVDALDYEPLEGRHYGLSGSWIAVLRRRHPSNEPRVVGLMLAKDEADAIPEVVANLRRALDTLYFYVPDAPTKAALLASSPTPSWARSAPSPPEGLRVVDGYRQELLTCARRDAMTDNDPRPLWVVSAQGDEVYHDDLRHHIRLAQAERATLLTCQVATFLLHESQREWASWSMPLAERLTHYIWDFGEHAGHLDFPWVYYDIGEHMRAHPHGTFVAKWATARPVRRHYPFRSPDQARERLKDRIESGWQPHYENYKDVFMGRTAAGREVKRYHGWFPEAERTEGVW